MTGVWRTVSWRSSFNVRFTQKRTCALQLGMSALGQQRTSRQALRQKEKTALAAVSPKSDQVAIHTPQLLVCLCATFEHADASLEAVLPGFGGLYLCLIGQPSKQLGGSLIFFPNLLARISI